MQFVPCMAEHRYTHTAGLPFLNGMQLRYSERCVTTAGKSATDHVHVCKHSVALLRNEFETFKKPDIYGLLPKNLS